MAGSVVAHEVWPQQVLLVEEPQQELVELLQQLDEVEELQELQPQEHPQPQPQPQPQRQRLQLQVLQPLEQLLPFWQTTPQLATRIQPPGQVEV